MAWGHPTSEVPQEGSLRGDPNRTALLATPSPVSRPGRPSREAPGATRCFPPPSPEQPQEKDHAIADAWSPPAAKHSVSPCPRAK